MQSVERVTPVLDCCDMSTLLDWLGLPASAAAQHRPPVVDGAASAASVAALLHDAGAHAAIVADSAGRAVGLVEATDLAAGLQNTTPPGASTAAVMQGPTALCGEGEVLHAAVARMRQEGRHALGLVTSDGRPAGLLTLDVALFLCSRRSAPCWTGTPRQQLRNRPNSPPHCSTMVRTASRYNGLWLF